MAQVMRNENEDNHKAPLKKNVEWWKLKRENVKMMSTHFWLKVEIEKKNQFN
jgi:hypothetical protein